MQIISHRGYWKTAVEKNSRLAFRRSLELGFGIETDIRDRLGDLVISHDPPNCDATPWLTLMELLADFGNQHPLAINIKSDGLHGGLSRYKSQIMDSGSFVFDMSVPDTLGYIKLGIPVFVRHSDIETDPVLLDQAAGIWLDQFQSDWVSRGDIARHLDSGRRLCLVSPELHGRNHRPQWEKLASSDIINHPNLMICTDFPEEARDTFQ